MKKSNNCHTLPIVIPLYKDVIPGAGESYGTDGSDLPAQMRTFEGSEGRTLLLRVRFKVMWMWQYSPVKLRELE